MSLTETFLLGFRQKVHRKSPAQAQTAEEPVWFVQTGNRFSNEAKGEACKKLQGTKRSSAPKQRNVSSIFPTTTWPRLPQQPKLQL